MPNKKKIFKKLDIIIIIVLLVVSFIPEVFYGYKFRKEYNSTYANITINGKLYKRIPLSSHRGEEEFIISTEKGENKVMVKDDSIAIIESDCLDQICVQVGFIKKPGQNIVCLPNRVMIEVYGENDDDIIIPY